MITKNIRNKVTTTSTTAAIFTIILLMIFSKPVMVGSASQVDCDANPDDAFCNGEKGRDGFPFYDIVDDKGDCYDRNDDAIGYW